MLGKGAKRKHDKDDDGLEGEAAVAAGRGGGPSKASYTLQRQTIFNMSLMKLYHPRSAAEPSLERRVLINNMLRRIQDELRREGGVQPLPLPLPASPPPEDPADEGFREPPPPPPGLAPPDSCLTPASLLEADASLFCSSPSPHTLLLHGAPSRPTPSPSPSKDGFSSALDEIEELCPDVATTTSPPPGASPQGPLLSPMLPAGGDLKARKPDGRGVLMATDPQPGGLDVSPCAPLSSSSSSATSSSSSGFLTDLALDDILFADIDTSMYDFDACTSASGPGTAKTAPVMTADDLVKTLSPYGGPGSGPASAAPSQPFKMDLAELDHIMEVLVGS